MNTSAFPLGVPPMKHQPQVTRLSWRPIIMVASFAALALCMVSVDWSEAQAQDAKAKKAKAKDFAKKAFAKKALDLTPQANSEPVPPRVIQLIPGTGNKVDHTALAKIIDDEINRKLAVDGVKASGKSSDAEFLRRVSLDLVGVVPTAEQV